MKPGILRTLFIAYMGFGLAIGLLFALFTQLVAASEAGMQFGFTIGCILAGLAIGIGNYGIARHLLLRPLRQAIAPALSGADPDNSQPSSPVKVDLIGEIINHFNRLTANAAEMVTRIGESTRTLEQESRQLSATAEEGRDKANRQQAECQQAVQAITNIRDTVQQITQMAEAVATSSAETDRSAKEGALIATEAIGSISGLIDDMNNAGKVISQLDEKSTSIGMVMDVIRNIAEQTNLLALNAAIEAARAGDQGRGFAVVADEVRTLATRTQESTLEIEGIIGHLQSGSRTAVGVMDNARERAMKTESHFEQAAELLAEMAGSIASLKEVSDGLSSAASEQNSFIGKAGGHMEQINQASGQNVQGAQHVAESSDRLNRQTRELSQILEQYR